MEQHAAFSYDVRENIRGSARRKNRVRCAQNRKDDLRFFVNHCASQPQSVKVLALFRTPRRINIGKEPIKIPTHKENTYVILSYQAFPYTKLSHYGTLSHSQAHSSFPASAAFWRAGSSDGMEVVASSFDALDVAA